MKPFSFGTGQFVGFIWPHCRIIYSRWELVNLWVLSGRTAELFILVGNWSICGFYLAALQNYLFSLGTGQFVGFIWPHCGIIYSRWELVNLWVLSGRTAELFILVWNWSICGFYLAALQNYLFSLGTGQFVGFICPHCRIVYSRWELVNLWVLSAALRIYLFYLFSFASVWQGYRNSVSQLLRSRSGQTTITGRIPTLFEQ